MSKRDSNTSTNTDRRSFMTSSIIGSAAVATGQYSAQGSSWPQTQPSEDIDSPIERAVFELSELSIADLQNRLRSGKSTSKALVELYLARIEEVDPFLGSIMETNPDAVKIAEKLDREFAAGKVRGPMHGIPVLVKDNLDTADKMKTTAGSLALMNTPVPSTDSFVVRKLREAGAVILGKTNLSEWANIRSSSSTSGWSGRRGQTNNPYALDRNPCGSSSGSGVAVAASLAAAAIGTETNGSITCPSACCGIVGIKPTVGLVSRTGIIPISHSQDTAGPMARSVRDAAILLSTIAGPDPEDEATADAADNAVDFTKFIQPEGLKGARIGVARNFFGSHPGIENLMQQALESISKAGAELVDTIGLSVQLDECFARILIPRQTVSAK